MAYIYGVWCMVYVMECGGLLIHIIEDTAHTAKALTKTQKKNLLTRFNCLSIFALCQKSGKFCEFFSSL